VVFGWNVVSRGTQHLDERPPALAVKLGRSPELHARNRQDEDSPPRANQSAAKRQPGRWLEGGPGNRDIEPLGRGRQIFATTGVEADPVAQSKLADCGAQERPLFGDRLAEANHQARAEHREWERRQAAAAADIDQSCRSVEPLRQRKGIWIVLGRQHRGRLGTGQIDFPVPLHEQRGEPKERLRLPRIARNPPSAPERLQGSPQIGLGIPCRRHRRPSTITRMLEKPRIDEVLIPFVRHVVGGPEASGGSVETMVGDASTRRYHRVRIDGGNPGSVVIMELPSEPMKSDEATAPGLGPPELPFLNVQRYLAAGGYPVPRVYRADMQLGLVALEDLGDRTFESAVRDAPEAERRRFYRTAIQQIVALQRLGDRGADPTCVAFGRRFDEPLLRWELDHFKEWYLEAERGVKLAPDEAKALAGAFDWLARELAGAPATLVHRDFQSRNLMVVGDAGPALKVIDFQDALMGTRAYDLVALLRDSYVVLSPAEVDHLVGEFIAEAGVADPVGFRRLFLLQTLQRKLKDVGRFVFIDRVRKNPSFLRWIPATVGYLRDAVSAAPPELEALRNTFSRHLPELTT
jgi:aminoglycoside/choline kinase family phosphotransferase